MLNLTPLRVLAGFQAVLLWVGIHLHHGKSLAAFLKAIGFTLSLMDGRDVASGQLERTVRGRYRRARSSS
ncbi:hypothetical protein BD310DRAFT_933225, partial [Dichomitus squalens]